MKDKTYWLVEASGDGPYESRIVRGNLEDVKRALVDTMFFGTYEEAMKDPMVAGYIESISDIENNWSEDGNVWYGDGEQCWFRVCRITHRYERSGGNENLSLQAMRI